MENINLNVTDITYKSELIPPHSCILQECKRRD